MRILKYEVNKKSVEVVGLGDLHLGNTNCDKNKILNVIKYIQTHNCLWIGGGDYGDAITPKDKRFDWRSIDLEYKSPSDQYRQVRQWFHPIRRKCLGLLDGNHDIKHWKEHSENYVKNMAEDLGVPYLTIDAYIRLTFPEFKNSNYDIYAHHGWTGARTKGGKITRVYDLAAVFPMIDLYIMFHMHDLGLADEQPNLYVDEELEIRDRIARYVFGGSFLKGYVKGAISYVEEKTYRPSVLGSPVIKVTPKQGKHTVSFDVAIKTIR